MSIVKTHTLETRFGLREIQKGGFQTAHDIQRAHEWIGGYFFVPSAMQFFNSRVLQKVYGGRVFITSERDEDRPRMYTVRCISDTGRILTVEMLENGTPAFVSSTVRSSEARFSSLAQARSFARKCEHEGIAEGTWNEGYYPVTITPPAGFEPYTWLMSSEDARIYAIAIQSKRRTR